MRRHFNFYGKDKLFWGCYFLNLPHNKYKECMLYTTLHKPFYESKYRQARATDVDGFFSDFANATAKNLCISLNRKSRQKHGRKIIQVEPKNSDFKGSNTPHQLRSMHTSETGSKNRSLFKPNLSIYDQERSHNQKRHTYNYQCCSSEREDQAENEVTNHPKPQKTFALIPAHTQNSLKQAFIQPRLLNEKQIKSTKVDETDENQGQFLQPKISLHSRKFSIHNKLVPIDFNESVSAKPSLVDLIKKFKFENLKTNNINSSSHSIVDNQKYDETEFKRNHSKKKTHPFFQEDVKRQFHQRKFSRKPSKEIHRVDRSNLTGLKKSNSILSPWGTIADHYFNQLPID